MALVKVLQPIPYWGLFFQPGAGAIDYSEEYYLVYTIGSVRTGLIHVNIDGDHFRYNSAGMPISGVIRSIEVTSLLSITKLNASLPEFYAAAFGSNPNGFDAPTTLFKGDDRFIGSIGDDIIPGGTSDGNDTANGYDGNDLILGDRGKDTLIGGSGRDHLSYETAPHSFRGINLDAQRGTVVDPWGDADTIVQFEGYTGSRFSDVIRGSAIEIETFSGLRGRDIIDGRGGFDFLVYTIDRAYGGSAPIRADLPAGKVTDGWGMIDTIANIEGVAGTARGDSFVGDDNDNVFAGFGGRDRFDGGAGDHDRVDFHDNVGFGASRGVKVNLSLTKGQILNDGFGNVETARSIEDVEGSALRDVIVGNNADNRLSGGDGDDVLYGGRGNDTLDGGEGLNIFIFNTPLDPLANVDVIERHLTINFSPFKLYLDEDIFIGIGEPGRLSPSRFTDAGLATTQAHRIVYDSTTGSVFYDPDGSGASDPVKFAQIDFSYPGYSGHPSLAPWYFMIIS